jgi:hypothetical protein
MQYNQLLTIIELEYQGSTIRLIPGGGRYPGYSTWKFLLIVQITCIPNITSVGPQRLNMFVCLFVCLCVCLCVYLFIVFLPGIRESGFFNCNYLALLLKVVDIGNYY